MSTPVGTAELDALESFYRDRDAPVFHEVCPLADASGWELLHRRGYRPVEFTSVMYRPVPRRGAPPPDSRLTVRRILPGEESLWAETSARGWSKSAELARFMLEFGRVSAECTEPFLAVLDGRPIAAGVLSLHGGVALLAGAATVPEARRQGAQRALLEARLRHAAQQGCDLAMMCAQPGSASQRNAERHGFRIAYTRLKWQLSAPAAAKPGSGG
jgi:GNAT superfamily N-acetyltransferase